MIDPTLFLTLDAAPLAIAVFASIACALPGNFLLLRRQALISDAISHVVLPGIVAAFLVTGVVATGPMLLGAGLAALLAVGLIEAIRRLGRVEAGAAMGVVFTVMFAAGVLALERYGVSSAHLDEHVLQGALERMVWLDGHGWGALVDAEALAGLPPELWRTAGAAALMVALTVAFWRPLAMSTFDEAYAASVGLPTTAIGFGLVIAAAVSAVAVFSAVGPILAIAMFVCPPAAARLLTSSLRAQVLLSVGIAAAGAVVGYMLAWDVSAAGMITAVLGLVLAAACALDAARRTRGG